MNDKKTPNNKTDKQNDPTATESALKFPCLFPVKIMGLNKPELEKLVLDIFKNINRIRKDGLTVLVVEQNVRMALLLADYGYVIKDGVIKVEGESKKLMYDESVKDSYLGGGGTTANV